MLHSCVYICNACGATKTITKHPMQTTDQFWRDLPETVSCGYRGCRNRALPKKPKNKLC